MSGVNLDSQFQNIVNQPMTTSYYVARVSLMLTIVDMLDGMPVDALLSGEASIGEVLDTAKNPVHKGELTEYINNSVCDSVDWRDIRGREAVVLLGRLKQRAIGILTNLNNSYVDTPAHAAITLKELDDARK